MPATPDDTPLDARARVEANRRLWDRWAERHLPSAFYDVEGFVADPASRPFDRIVRDVLGDIAGKRALHLQCHFGLDTLRLALLGAEATGVDFSPTAIAAARELSARTGIPATFVEAEVTALPDEVPRESFDLVFTSYGAISWLPDLAAWAETIASRLAPGGTFKIVEAHPFLWVFDEESEDPELRVRYSYFDATPLEWEEYGSYAAPGPEYTGTSHSWQHTMEETVGVLLAAGLVLEDLQEYPLIAWQHMPHMVEIEPGLWGLPPGSVEVPLLFSLVARKP